MELFNQVFIQDLEAYKEGLENKDFRFCNVISNRITIDAVFLESKEYALIGAILKDVLPEFRRVEESDEEEIRKKFIAVLNDYIKHQEDLNYSFILSRFSEFFDQNKKYFTSSYEDYSENKDYTSKIIKFCLEFINNELEENNLPYSDDLLILGVLNEISRASRQFGCTTHQHILQYILSFSQRLQDFFKVLLLSSEVPDPEKWKERYEKYRDLLKNNVKGYDLSEEYIKKSLDDLFQLIKEWRFMFMRLMSIMVPIPQQSQQIKIPSRIENELKDMVSKAISKELEGEEK